MKTTVVPAQVTTVEDKVAGNLSFPQIIILIITLLVGTAIYILVPPKTNFTIAKLILIIIQFMFIGGLAIRYKDKIIGDWLIIIIRYNSRPKRYIFTKNDLSARKRIIQHKILPKVKSSRKKAVKNTQKHFSRNSYTKADRIIENPNLSISFKLAKKGGIDVTFDSSKR